MTVELCVSENFQRMDLLRASMSGMLWLDGGDEQEDELDDVAKGKLQPSTPKDDEVPGDVVIRPDRDEALIEEDEEDDGSQLVN